MNSTNADKELIRRLEGMFVGQLNDDEMESFNRCVSDGLARRSHEGGAGFMGLAKVRNLP